MEPPINETPLEEAQNSSVPVEDAPEDSSSQPEEEDDECRVCRGPAEEGHPLFAPCKCSGSIGLTHQDCLVSWLDVTRGDGRCELCKTKFRFDPQYAENAPDRLPAHEVVLGLSSRFLAKWLPLALRILIAATLWLVVAPYLTACLYHGWMHRPSSIVARWSRQLIPADIVSGAIILAIIIISFLSLMSFADFLRVHWGEPENEAQRRRNGHGNEFAADFAAEEANEGGIDDTIVDFIEENGVNRPDEAESVKPDNDQGTGNPEGVRQQLESTIRGALQRAAADNNVDQELYSDSDSDYNPEDDDEEEDMDDDELDDDLVEDAGEENERNAEPQQNGGRDDNRPFDPMDPILQDDQADMEINVALDELLGLRGPPSTLIRNLLWLLAFNATYLGFFAFVPKTVGSAVFAGLLNTTTCEKLLRTVPYVYSEHQNATSTSVNGSIALLNQASADLNTTFRLPDVATITLGYFSIAAMIVLLRYWWILVQKLRQHFSVEGTRLPSNERADHFRNFDWQDARLAIRREAMNDLDERDMEIGAGTAFGVILDAAVAIVKVAILLFLKMFVLPVVLGLCLDASTVSLFGQTLAERLTFAGTDLFSFVLLHWVAGITFMLLVTVFLLQLREVTHPDLLARLIRPQEPQPDLLGNLMNETVTTHMKRMLLSLAIYAPILLLHVTLPVQLLLRSGLPAYLPVFRLNFWHIVMPQMQIPLELIIFHLSMLALLERYKNTIGLLQHTWMKVMCRKMGLTEYILPLTVEKFELVGTKAVFRVRKGEGGALGHEIDPFWYQLSDRKGDVDLFIDFIESNIEKGGSLSDFRGETKRNGERVLSSSVDYIRLPDADEVADAIDIDDDITTERPLLPTKIGRYRLRCQGKERGKTLAIEFWREVTGDEIPRPPEGWDDLGAGGAFVQGRWAWSKERKSVIEGGVAKRTNFRDPTTKKRPAGLMLKVAALMVFSWFAITFAVFGFISLPLSVGRMLYMLFRFDASYIHDPLAFVIGGCLVFPGISLILASVKLAEGDHAGRLRRWIQSFRMPPGPKLVVVGASILLWCGITPLVLGTAYELAAVKTSRFFVGGEKIVDTRSVLLSWMVGNAMLNAWAFFAYFSVFTKQFWANVGNGMLEPPLDENGNPVPPRNNDDNQGINGQNVADRMSWQGKEGRVARFFNIWRVSLLEWNWEKVDHVPLLEEFAYPISRQLLSALVGSALSFIFLMNLVPLLLRSESGKVLLPILGGVERGLFRQIVFRICMGLHVIVQVCSANRGRLEGWFEAAHAAARDDRYLIGEVLMNYQGGEGQ